MMRCFLCGCLSTDQYWIADGEGTHDWGDRFTTGSDIALCGPCHKEAFSILKSALDDDDADRLEVGSAFVREVRKRMTERRISVMPGACLSNYSSSISLEPSEKKPHSRKEAV